MAESTTPVPMVTTPVTTSVTSATSATSAEGAPLSPGSDAGSLTGSRPSLPMSRLKLSDLEMKTTLGTGTFGRVMLVRHRESNKFYALKMLQISEVLRLKQCEHVRSEKEILSTIRHPFIVNLLWTDHCQRFLYMLFDYVGGGEVFMFLRNANRFDSRTAQFYSAEIILVLDYLHSMSLVYRDLKPENLLLDTRGHIRICDFGFAKKVLDRTWTLCGTPEYLAPEIIQSKGYNKSVDWWALGIFIYEMLVGYPPFFDERPFAIYEKILAAKIDFPKHVDSVAKDLIKRLLTPDRTKRLGNMKNGAAEIKDHRWYHGINWDDIFAKKVEAPIIPQITHEGDTQNFDKYPEMDMNSIPLANDADAAIFADF